MTGASARAAVVAPLLAPLALAGAGCGPPPPQAPAPQVRKLDEATGAIATACGEAYQVQAFPPVDRAALATLTATATAKGYELASVYAHNPSWIFQGETIRRLVADAVIDLRDCGLPQAAASLRVATASPRR